MAATESSFKMTIGEGRVTMADVKDENIDLKSRDPEQLHGDLKVRAIKSVVDCGKT